MNHKQDPNWLSSYSEGSAAIHGETAIIKKILEIIGTGDFKWCVDFGAGNGISASNTNFFINEEGFSAVLIEPMKSRYESLKNYYKNNKNVITLNSFVGFSGNNTLDILLKDTGITKNFDFLSVDIDGNDYHVWKAIKNYFPKVVCIEFNQTVPPNIEFIQNADPNVNQGTGILSFYKLAKEKGYELVCVSEYNAFFVLKEYFHLFHIDDNSPHLMCSDEEITYLFTGYDGKIFLEGSKKIRWHSMEINERKIQQIPKLIQKFPPNYNFLERFFFRLWRFKSSPKKFLESIMKKNR